MGCLCFGLLVCDGFWFGKLLVWVLWFWVAGGLGFVIVCLLWIVCFVVGFDWLFWLVFMFCCVGCLLWVLGCSALGL